MTAGDTTLTTHRTEHRVTVSAPARRVFDLVADITGWPHTFPPTVHAEYAERGASEERIRIWATANGEVKAWTSHRSLDREGLRVRFRQEKSQHPVAGMGGEWIIRPVDGERSEVILTHDFQAVEDDPAHVDWIHRAVDRNSGAELAALKAAAERADGADGTLFTFADEVTVTGAPGDVYDYLNEARRWQERLPHVAAVSLDEPAPGVQRLGMDTKGPDGTVHTTESVRICFPQDRIVYKQFTMPPLMAVHTGTWRIAPAADGHGTTVTSLHTVVVDDSAVTTVLGPDATLADARRFLRDALGRNSRTTLGFAKEYAEERARRA
ncbi:aromatase/cyclase [Streptomyces nogalater]|uniref:Aromatase/cyclase n=1 Tax=Streptomyces nogalater TaxID=38314 RepID=A0ABW0WDA8_STRNO|nr:SnoaE [Cosmid vector pSnogaori_NGS]